MGIILAIFANLAIIFAFILQFNIIDRTGLRSLPKNNFRELAIPSQIESDPNPTPLFSLGLGSSGAFVPIVNSQPYSPPQGSHLYTYHRVHPC